MYTTSHQNRSFGFKDEGSNFSCVEPTGTCRRWASCLCIHDSEKTSIVVLLMVKEKKCINLMRHPSVNPSTHPSISPSVHLSTQPPTHLFTLSLTYRDGRIGQTGKQTEREKERTTFTYFPCPWNSEGMLTQCNVGQRVFSLLLCIDLYEFNFKQTLQYKKEQCQGNRKKNAVNFHYPYTKAF